MATGERRTVSGRRGMTVLGKIPAVPKPINLPSQRLENRGLDPNVELVPRGSLGWGSAGRSPPVNSSPWGNTGLASSPPVNTGTWSNVVKVQAASTPGNGAGGLVKSPPRPASAESGARPSSAPATTNRVWGGAVKLDEPVQPANFNLTHVDFPTLGSEKNPNLRPQQSVTLSHRPTSADGTSSDKERLPASRDTVSSNRPASADTTLYKERFPFHQDGSEHGTPNSDMLGSSSYPRDGHNSQPSFVQKGMAYTGSNMVPAGLGMYASHLEHYGYYRSPGAPHYSNMEERDMVMLGMTGSHASPVAGNSGLHAMYPVSGSPVQFARPGMYRGFHPQPGPPEHYGRIDHPTSAGGYRPPGPNIPYSHDKGEFLNHERHERDVYPGAGHDFGKGRDDWLGRMPRVGVPFGMERESSGNAQTPTTSGFGIGFNSPKASQANVETHYPDFHDWAVDSNGNESMGGPRNAAEGAASATMRLPVTLAVKSPKDQRIDHDNQTTDNASNSKEYIQGSGSWNSSEPQIRKAGHKNREQPRGENDWRSQGHAVVSRHSHDASIADEHDVIKKVKAVDIMKKTDTIRTVGSTGLLKGHMELSSTVPRENLANKAVNVFSEVPGKTSAGQNLANSVHVVFSDDAKDSQMLQRRTTIGITEKNSSQGNSGLVSDGIGSQSIPGIGFAQAEGLSSGPAASTGIRKMPQGQVPERAQLSNNNKLMFSNTSKSAQDSQVGAGNPVGSLYVVPAIRKHIQADKKSTMKPEDGDSKTPKELHDGGNADNCEANNKIAADITIVTSSTDAKAETIILPRVVRQNEEALSSLGLSGPKEDLTGKADASASESEVLVSQSLEGLTVDSSKQVSLGNDSSTSVSDGNLNKSAVISSVDVLGKNIKESRKTLAFSDSGTAEGDNGKRPKYVATGVVSPKDEQANPTKAVEVQAPVIVEEGQANGEDGKKGKRKSNLPRRFNRDRPVPESRNLDRSNVSEGLVWAPVRNSWSPNVAVHEQSRKEEEARSGKTRKAVDAESHLKQLPTQSAEIRFQELPEQGQIYTPSMNLSQVQVRKMQPHSATSSQQGQCEPAMDGSSQKEHQEHATPAKVNTNNAKFETRKIKGDTGVYVPKPLRKEEHLSTGNQGHRQAETRERPILEEQYMQSHQNSTAGMKSNSSKNESSSRYSREEQIQHQQSPASTHPAQAAQAREKKQGEQFSNLPAVDESEFSKKKNGSAARNLKYAKEQHIHQGLGHLKGRPSLDEREEQSGETLASSVIPESEKTSKNRDDSKIYVSRHVRQQQMQQQNLAVANHPVHGPREASQSETNKSREEGKSHIPKHGRSQIQQYHATSNQGFKQMQTREASLQQEQWEEPPLRSSDTGSEFSKNKEDIKYVTKVGNQQRNQHRQSVAGMHLRETHLLEDQSNVVPVGPENPKKKDENKFRGSNAVLNHQQSGASNHQGHKHQRQRFSTQQHSEQDAGTSVDLVVAGPEASTHEDEILPELGNSRDEIKRAMPKSARQQQSAASSHSGHKPFPKEQWEPVQTPAIPIPESSKRKSDMKRYTPKPIRQQQMQQQQSAASNEEMGELQIKVMHSSNEKEHNANRKSYSQKFMPSKGDGTSNDNPIHQPQTGGSEADKQGGMRESSKEVGNPANMYWRRHESSQRQYSPAGTGNQKQQVYVVKATESVGNQENAPGNVKSAKSNQSHEELHGHDHLMVQPFQRKEYHPEAGPENELSTGQADDGTRRFARHENMQTRRGRFHGHHRARAVDNVS